MQNDNFPKARSRMLMKLFLVQDLDYELWNIRYMYILLLWNRSKWNQSYELNKVTGWSVDFEGGRRGKKCWFPWRSVVEISGGMSRDYAFWKVLKRMKKQTRSASSPKWEPATQLKSKNLPRNLWDPISTYTKIQDNMHINL